jgi:hypothetical protein
LRHELGNDKTFIAAARNKTQSNILIVFVSIVDKIGYRLRITTHSFSLISEVKYYTK